MFNGGTPLSEVVEHLEAGPNQADNSYVIPEGYTIKQTAHAVSEAYAGSISEADFLAAAQDASRFSDRFSFVKDAYNNSLEGFLFPKTYEIMAGANADDVVAQMLTQYEQEVKQLNYTYPHDAGLSDYEVLILASIIEREAAADNKKAVALEGIARLKSFFKSIGLPVTFSELGIENPDIDRLADSLHRNKGELVGNYVKLTKEDSKEIYRLAL